MYPVSNNNYSSVKKEKQAKHTFSVKKAILSKSEYIYSIKIYLEFSENVEKVYKVEASTRSYLACLAIIRLNSSNN